MQENQFNGQRWYEQQMEARVRTALIRKNIQFALDHADDETSKLSEYLADSARLLGHPPTKDEIIGGDFIEMRFGSWKAALASIGTRWNQPPPKFRNRAIVKAEYEIQKKLYRQETTQKKLKKQQRNQQRQRQRLEHQPERQEATA